MVTTLRWTKTSGPNRRIKEMPLCVSEAAFFEDPDWPRIGFELLQWLATFSRDYLLPKLKPSHAVFEKKMVSESGHPRDSSRFSEHSERSVLPTGLSVLGVTGPEKESRKLRYLCPVLRGPGGEVAAQICCGR